MRCRWLFIQLSRASGREKDGASNVWSKPRGIIEKSTALACWTGVMAGRVDESRKARTAVVFWKPSPCRCGSFQTARTSGHRDCRQPQDAYLGWVPARARAGLTELREHLRLVYTPAYDPDANRHSHGSGASRDGWSRIIIIAVRSSCCSRIWRRIFRLSLGLLTRSFVILAARLHPTRRLLCYLPMLDQQLGSI
jgi:hypothetical protein